MRKVNKQKKVGARRTLYEGAERETPDDALPQRDVDGRVALSDATNTVETWKRKRLMLPPRF
jgi:hypothetical protein